MGRKEKQTNKWTKPPNQPKKKKQRNPATKTSRIFNQMTAKTWNPIHVSLQPCKKILSCSSSFALTESLRGQRMQCVVSVLTFCILWIEQTTRSSEVTAHEEFISRLQDRSWIPTCYLCFTSLTQERRHCLHLASAAKVAPQHLLVHLTDIRDTLLLGWIVQIVSSIDI